MISNLIIDISDSYSLSGERVRVDLTDDLLSTEEQKLQLLRTIISSLASAIIEVKLTVTFYNTSEMNLVKLKDKIKEVNNKKQGYNQIDLLSKREKEVLALILKGHTTNEISEKLFICYETVKSHRKNILSKTGSRNTASLVKFFQPADL